MNNIIKGILVQPGCIPIVVEFNNTLKRMQSLVCGRIEPVYLGYDEDVVVFVNEEGKLFALPSNKIVISKKGEILDTLVGNILIVGNNPNTGETISIPEGKLSKYFNMFLDNKIIVGGDC